MDTFVNSVLGTMTHLVTGRSGMELMTLIVLTITAVVLFAHLRAFKRETDSSYLRSFFERYESSDMYEGLAAFGEFKTNQENLLKKLQCLMTKSVDEFTNTDLANAYECQRFLTDAHGAYANQGRRRILNLYKHAWRLHKKGFLGKDALMMVSETNAVSLLDNAVLPTSTAIHLTSICKGNFQEFVVERSHFNWFDDYQSWRAKNMKSPYNR